MSTSVPTSPQPSLSPSRVWSRAVAIAARHGGLPPESVTSPRGRAARRARQLAFYLAVVEGGVPKAAVARIARVRRYTLQFGIAAVEDAREDDLTDRVITDLEQRLAA